MHEGWWWPRVPNAPEIFWFSIHVFIPIEDFTTSSLTPFSGDYGVIWYICTVVKIWEMAYQVFIHMILLRHDIFSLPIRTLLVSLFWKPIYSFLPNLLLQRRLDIFYDVFFLFVLNNKIRCNTIISNAKCKEKRIYCSFAKVSPGKDLSIWHLLLLVFHYVRFNILTACVCICVHFKQLVFFSFASSWCASLYWYERERTLALVLFYQMVN